MSEWNCPECKINFKEKPTFTTTCPFCKGGLTPDTNPMFKFQDEEVLVSSRCAWCGEKLNSKTAIKIKKPQIYESEPCIMKSNLIHKKCNKKIIEGDCPEASCPEDIKYFQKEYEAV